MEEVNNNRPLVTILILCYNHEDYIAQTLESAFNQDYDNYEIIIRDDNSTDNSQQVIASTINKLQSGNKSIRIFTDFGDENLGLIRSYNKIFKLAQGNIICSLGGDDRAAPIRVRRTVDMFLKYDVDLVASNAFIIDAKSNITSDKFYTRHSRVFSTEFKQEDNCYLVKEMPWNESCIYIHWRICDFNQAHTFKRIQLFNTDRFKTRRLFIFFSGSDKERCRDIG